MYSYDRIKKIKSDLSSILSALKGDLRLSGILTAEEIKGFELALEQYDVVLDEIGPGGFCDDEVINSGFHVTENFILDIRKKMK